MMSGGAKKSTFSDVRGAKKSKGVRKSKASDVMLIIMEPLSLFFWERVGEGGGSLFSK